VPVEPSEHWVPTFVGMTASGVGFIQPDCDQARSPKTPEILTLFRLANLFAGVAAVA